MKNRRLHLHQDGSASFDIFFEGETILAYEGETIAGVLTAARKLILRFHTKNHEARGVHCGIGVCYDCVVLVEGLGIVRSCMTPVAPGMKISILKPELNLERHESPEN